MAQTLLPDGNSGTTNWTQAAGDGDGDWFDELDEGVAGNDGDTTVWRTVSPTNEPIAVTLQDGTDPGVGTGHIMRAVWRKNATGGVVLSGKLELLEGATVRASAIDLDVAEATHQTFEYTLSEAEADAITDYTDLILRVTGNVESGSGGRALMLTALELEIPDAAGGGEETASVAPVSVAISLPAVTPTYASELAASVVPVAVSVALPAVTAQFSAVYQASVSPVAVTISLPGVTASHSVEGTASVSPVAVTVSLPAVTATYESELTAAVSPVAVSVGLPSVTATSDVVSEPEEEPTTIVFGGVSVATEEAEEERWLEGRREIREFWRRYHETVQAVSDAEAAMHPILTEPEIETVYDQEIERDDLEVLSLL